MSNNLTSTGRKVGERKRIYREKLIRYLQDYKTVLIVGANFVGSHQLQQVRQKLRGRGVILMGKNTMIRMVLRQYMQQDPRAESLVPHVQGNCGFVFTNEDVRVIRDELQENKVPAIAKPGILAPNDVNVDAGPTGLDPGQTSFFQALGIGTKIVRGQIEITNKVYLIKKDETVTASQCALLNKLDIKPFEYGLSVQTIYMDGSAMDPSVIDLTEDDLSKKFFSAVRVVASLGLRLGLPNLATVPHSFGNAFRKLLALSVATDYTFDASKSYKEYLTNPDAYAAKHGIVADAPAGDDKDKPDEAAPADAADDSESAESSESGGAMGMFGSDSDSDSD